MQVSRPLVYGYQLFGGKGERSVTGCSSSLLVHSVWKRERAGQGCNHSILTTAHRLINTLHERGVCPC